VLGRSYEIIVVDDGSEDKTYARLLRLAAADPSLKLVQLRRNFGQTAAMAAGFDHATGAVIVPMDGDLQNDPTDISRLLQKMDEGYDVVSGWRRERKDGFVRRLPSRVANWLIGRVTGVRLHDYGCTLKAYRADIVRDTNLYGEMHRFLPALAYQAGARITEVPVAHHPRVSGRSKYGLGRTIKVLLDLVTVKFLSVWSTKPSYVFGGSGAVLCILGTGFVLWTAYEKLVNGVYVYRQPSLVVGVFLFTIGLNLFLMGLLAELVTRTYHESQSKPIYHVRERTNFEDRAPTSRERAGA
jgi:glycosyltransferase involved in cell wall biosynthesis